MDIGLGKAWNMMNVMMLTLLYPFVLPHTASAEKTTQLNYVWRSTITTILMNNVILQDKVGSQYV